MNSKAETHVDRTDWTDTKQESLDTSDLRVAIFSDAMPERNGAGAYYEDLAAHLRPRLGELKLFQPVIKKRFLKFAIPLPGDPTQKLITPNIFRIRKEFKSLDPHLVISVTPGPFGLLGFYYARKKQRGLLTAFHTDFEGLARLYGNSILYKLAYVCLKAINGYLCRNSDSVLVNNVELRDTVKRMGARKIEVMGTPLAKVFLDKPMSPPGRKLQKVVFAGRLAPEKNIEGILLAIKNIPQIDFIIVGDGPLRDQLETAATQYSNLRVTGWLNREKLCEVIDSANLLILPSYMETFGTVALEAMARGRPALVSESAGIHAWPSLKDSLFTIKIGESLTDALNNLLQLSAEDLANIAVKARHAAESLNEKTVEQWQVFIRDYSRHDF